jgi:Zn-dependent protease/CBS domain-containing protein
MNKGLRIARIFGIDIQVDWSWLLIFVLITWSLSTTFASIHSNWNSGLVWGISAAAAILLFVSVLLHELAHSLVAKARGLPVRRILLFLFGGVSNIEREPSSPGVEFVMALVGPLTSIVLGVILLLAGGFTASAGAAVIANPANIAAQLSPLDTILLWLGSINVFLGIFNMIPGFPLDGGRVLRSILWAATHNLRQATRWASWVGQGIAWLMIFSGISMVFGMQVPVLGGGIIEGIWLAFIGWFLNSSSVASYRQVVIHDLLQDIPVSRLMRADPPTVPSIMTVDALVHDKIIQSDDHAFPVVDNDRLVGMVTLEDVRAIARNTWGSTSVRQIMTPLDKLVTLDVEDCADEAFQKLQTNDVNQLPVMKGNTLAGLLRRRDIIKWLHLEANAFRN